MKDNDVNDFDALIQRYIAVWNETHGTARRRAVEQVWATRRRLHRPAGGRSGPRCDRCRDPRVPRPVPGLALRLAGSVDTHHDQACFRWTLSPTGGEPLIVGFDVVERDRNGQLALVLGFLDEVPAAA